MRYDVNTPAYKTVITVDEIVVVQPDGTEHVRFVARATGYKLQTTADSEERAYIDITNAILLHLGSEIDVSVF